METEIEIFIVSPEVKTEPVVELLRGEPEAEPAPEPEPESNQSRFDDPEDVVKAMGTCSYRNCNNTMSGANNEPRYVCFHR